MPFIRKRGDLVVYEVISQLPDMTFIRAIDLKYRYASTTFPIQNSALYTGGWFQCDIDGNVIRWES